MQVREISDEEVSRFHRDGWVKLPGLVDRESIATILMAGKELLAENAGSPDGATFFKVRNQMASNGIEPYRSFCFNRTLARNAERLLGRERLVGHRVPVRLRADSLTCKWPENGPTPPHEDYTGHGLDRPASLTMWIALEPTTPDMGSMRFLTGSFREGPFGHLLSVDPETGKITETGIFQQYPGLLELFEWSDWQGYEPGDATVHHSCTIHEAQANQTDRSRYNYVLVYSSDDCLIRENPILGYHRQDEENYPIVSPVVED